MSAELTPTLLPLGDRALLVRYADTLSDAANLAAIALARQLADEVPEGVEEIAPGLVSVLLRLAPQADFAKVRGEMMLRLGRTAEPAATVHHEVAVRFDGENQKKKTNTQQKTPNQNISQHNTAPLRVLATGFAPGFV